MNSIWFLSTAKKFMKKRCKKAPDPRIKHRIQIGETTL